MGIEFQMTDENIIAVLTGELDHHSAASLREEIDKTYEAFNAKNLIFDFSGLSFMDSAGIGVIMGRYNKVTANAGKVYVTEASEYIKKILDMAGIFTIVEYRERLGDALDELNGQICMQLKMDAGNGGDKW